MSSSVTTPETHRVIKPIGDREVAEQLPARDSVGCRIDVIGPSEINDCLRADWQLIRNSSACFRPPFFSASFVEQVARLVPDVEIGVAVQNGRAVGIFPFQRQGRTTAKPVGLGINDAHGLIARPGAGPGLREMMAACRINSFPFHAAPAETSEIADYQLGTTRSYLADLMVDPQGYEHYLRENRNTIDKQGQKTRRMIRDLGPLKFEFDCRDPEVLDRLIELKCEQYRRTHTYCILGVPWIRQLLRNMHVDREAPVRGVLNALHAGDKLVAMHYGILEGDLLHYWFPVFDAAYGFGSPGTQLFLDVAREARERGVVAIDMGYGEQPYKTKLTNVITEMSYGLVDDHPLRRAWHRQKLALLAGWRSLKFRETIKPWARKLLPHFGQGKYQT